MKISLQNTEKPFQAFDITLSIESVQETSDIIDLFMKDGSVAYRDIARKVMQFSPLDVVKKTELLLEMEGSAPKELVPDIHSPKELAPEIHAAMQAHAPNLVCNFGNEVTLSTDETPTYNPDYAVESDYDVPTDTIEQDHEKFQDLTETVRKIQAGLSPTVTSKTSSVEEVVALRNALFDESDNDMPFYYRLDKVVSLIYDLFNTTQGSDHHLTDPEIFALIDNLGSLVNLDVHNEPDAEKVCVALQLELAPHITVADIINTLINNHYEAPDQIAPAVDEFPEPFEQVPEQEMIDKVMEQMNRIHIQPDTPSIQTTLQASKEKLEQNLIKPEPCIGDDCPDGEGVMFR